MQEHSVKMDTEDALQFAEFIVKHAKDKIEVSVILNRIVHPRKPAETIILFCPVKMPKRSKDKVAFCIRIKDHSWMNS